MASTTPSGDVNIGGGTTNLPIASTIDGANDYIPIYTAGATATQAITRNVYLGLASAPIGTSDSQTMTNKTLTSPTISGPTLSGTVGGTYTIGGMPTFPASVVTLTGSQTLTNKILTSPTINAPTITNATISADAITGFTTSTNGTLYGITIASSVITTAGSVGSGANVTNGVQAAALATNAITLGYVQITTSFSTASGTNVQVTGLTSTVTIPAGGRRIKVTMYCYGLSDSGGFTPVLSLWDGTVGSGTQIAQWNGINSATLSTGATMIGIVSPAAGSKTYNVGLSSAGGGTATVAAASGTPAFILVEAI